MFSLSGCLLPQIEVNLNLITFLQVLPVIPPHHPPVTGTVLSIFSFILAPGIHYQPFPLPQRWPEDSPASKWSSSKVLIKWLFTCSAELGKAPSQFREQGPCSSGCCPSVNNNMDRMLKTFGLGELAGSVERATLDLRLLSSSPMLDMEII